MAITATTTLDHIDKIEVPGAVFDKPANEYWALLCLRDGLEFLYKQALRCDETVKQLVNPRGDVRFCGIGNFPGSDQIPKSLLTCAFHWYAISACQYVRSVGAIAHKQDSTRPKPPDYEKKVIPAVRAFRDKVAAHFAWAGLNSQDNDAERVASILPPLTFEDDSFHVGALSVGLHGGGKDTDSQNIAPWSICKVHESLRARYWPQPK